MPIGQLTVNDMGALTSRISIAIQKEAFVRKSAIASMVVPGLGQFINTDIGAGLLSVGADIILLSGTFIGGYYLLPANVQFGSLDYLNTPLADIHAAWTSNTLISYLPAAGVIVGGMIVSVILRHFSAEKAADLAVKNITEGKVLFEPEFSLMRNGPGFGMRMRF